MKWSRYSDSTQSDAPGYTGHVEDDDLGLVYMQQRYYDANIGRFYSNDPVGFKASNPMLFNRYAYANNNPYKYVDPDGREGIGLRLDMRVRRLGNGSITTSQYKSELRAETVGGAVGLAVLAGRGAVLSPLMKQAFRKVPRELRNELAQEVLIQISVAVIEVSASSGDVKGSMPMQSDGQLNGNRNRSTYSSQSIAPEQTIKKAETQIEPPKRLGTRIRR